MEIINFIKDTSISILTALVTAKFVLHNYKNKVSFDVRKKLYSKYLKILFALKREPFLQFSSKTINQLESMQVEYSIFASKKCRKDFFNLLEIIIKMYNDFQNYRDPDDELLFEGDTVDAIIMQEIYDSYKEKNQITISNLERLIENSIQNIHKSLGIK